MFKILHISEINTDKMFETKKWTFGDKKGCWFVVSENDYYLGRYINKADAEEHIRDLLEPENDEIEFSESAKNWLEEIDYLMTNENLSANEMDYIVQEVRSVREKLILLINFGDKGDEQCGALKARDLNNLLTKIDNLFGFNVKNVELNNCLFISPKASYERN